MSPDQVSRFNDAHRAMLARDFPGDPLRIPHRLLPFGDVRALMTATRLL